CESELITPVSGADYRLDAWIKCASGEARVGVDFLDEKGRVLTRRTAPAVSASVGWRYVAAEMSAPERAGAANRVRARVWFRVKGRAEVDDVGLAPVSLSWMGNKGLEADERGRIGFWSEEKDDTLLPGRRAGEVRPDPSVKREGRYSALLKPTGDWVAL